MEGKQWKYWVFTDFKPKHWLKMPKRVIYITWQLEKCPDTGRLHHQGYLELNRSMRMTWVKKMLEGEPHVEARKGSQMQAAEYCHKKETRVDGPWELGTKSAGQGARTDIVAYRDAIKKGKRKRELIDEMPVMMCKYPRFYNLVREQTRPRRTKELEVILAVGKTRIGKSQWGADKWATNPEYFTLPMCNGTQWYDGYDGHKIVQIDEFTGKMRLDVCLQLLDKYPTRAPVKCAFTWWMPDIIYLTSNVPPWKWYKWIGREDQRDALKHRFTKVLKFHKGPQWKKGEEGPWQEPEEMDIVKWRMDWPDEDTDFTSYELAHTMGNVKKNMYPCFYN